MRAAALLALLLPVAVHGAEALSPEALRSMSQRAEDAAQRSKERASASQPAASLLSAPAAAPVPVPAAPSAPTVPQTDKYRTPAPAAAPMAPAPSYSTPRHATPPPSPAPSGPVKLDVAKPKGTRYGIRLGTVLQGEVRRNISSAEPGLAEIWLTKDAIGDKRTLPAGTQLFAQMRVNAATKRLELTTVTGITPDGDEFQLTARVFDTAQVSGLAGIVNDASEAIAQKGVNRGLMAAGQAALSNVAGGGPGGAAVSAGAGSVLSDTDQRLQAETNTNIVVYVSPQPVLLRVDKTF